MTKLAINSKASNINDRRTLAEHPSVADNREPIVVTKASSMMPGTPHEDDNTSS